MAHIDGVSYTCSQDTLASGSQMESRYTGVEECWFVSSETRDTVHVELNGKVQNTSTKLAVASYTVLLCYLVLANKVTALKGCWKHF